MVFQRVSFSVETTFAFGDELGTVTNLSPDSITPTWYLEASSFRDDQPNFKFGGSNTSFRYSLARDQSTRWQISSSNAQYPATEYPTFANGALRVFKNLATE